ncbi:hypothetical protein EV14_3059 [Prochlorococcus sp. MIT 0703]|nr:hypothetical protein EV14_3059 [Prochlorococcus sp. MIT 0703]
MLGLLLPLAEIAHWQCWVAPSGRGPDGSEEDYRPGSAEQERM